MVNEWLKRRPDYAVPAHSILKHFRYAAGETGNRRASCARPITSRALLAATFVLADFQRPRRRRRRLDGQQSLRRSLAHQQRRAAGFAEAGRVLEAGRHHSHRQERPRAAQARRRNHDDRAEFGGRRARREEGRAVDHDRAAGRLDPARCRKAQRQAFRGRNPLSRRRGEGHAVSRHRERRQHQRRRDPRPGRSCRLHAPDRSRRSSRASTLPFRERQRRPFARRIRHVRPDRTGQASRAFDRTRAGAARRPHRAAPRHNRTTRLRPLAPESVHAVHGKAASGSLRRSARSSSTSTRSQTASPATNRRRMAATETPPTRTRSGVHPTLETMSPRRTTARPTAATAL